MKTWIPVIYIGKQVGATDNEYLDLVDEPGGFTKVFDPAKHLIVGMRENQKTVIDPLTFRKPIR